MLVGHQKLHKNEKGTKIGAALMACIRTHLDTSENLPHYMVELKLLCVVWVYYAHMNVCDPYFGNDLTNKHDRGNPHDEYAVAVLPVDEVYR